MANLASSAVTVNKAYARGSRTGKKTDVRLDVTLVLTGQGDATNTIPASVFGLSAITDAGVFTASDNSIVIVAAPSYSGSILLLKAAGTNAPGTYTATVKGWVAGY